MAGKTFKCNGGHMFVNESCATVETKCPVMVDPGHLEYEGTSSFEKPCGLPAFAVDIPAEIRSALGIHQR